MNAYDAKLPEQDPGRYCEHCGCDQDHAQPSHGENCPRYDGPTAEDELRAELEELKERVRALEEKKDGN